MEIQLMIPSPPTTPYTTAPSTPHHFPNFYYSAPTTPIHTTFHDDNDNDDDEDYDFAFDFSGQLEPPSISAADELFHCGQIKTSNTLLPDHPKTPTYSKKKSTFYPTQPTQNSPKQLHETTSSPFRISDILSEEDNYKLDTNNNKNALTWYYKWNLKNLLLFRSTSEGSARRKKEIVNRYAKITKVDEDVKGSSFRSTESCGSVVGSSRRVVRRKVSAHEVHYTANRAVYEEMRRKTYLPYKSGLLGCLGFRNNVGAGIGTVHHEISRGVGYVVKQP